MKLYTSNAPDGPPSRYSQEKDTKGAYPRQR